MNDKISLATVIARRDNLMVAELSENELVMLSVGRGAYYGMEETAKVIWDYLSEPCSITELVNHLLTRFAVDRQTCEGEVLAFVNELHRDELIRVVDGSA